MNTTDPITLDTPIKRGETKITSITLRKPGSGELRGLTLTALLQMDVSSLHKLIPRISTPTLTEHEVTVLMDPADLTQCGTAVSNFLLPKALREQGSQSA